MNRSTRTFVVLSVATLTAAIASFGVYAAVKSIPVREVEVASSFVVVAAKNLPTGARVGKEDVKLVPWPSGSPVPGAFAKIEDVVDRGLLAAALENEPITETRLAPLSAGAGLPPTIPSGMRAMSVKVDEVVGVAGFVVPGTRVDVVVTIRRMENDQEPMSRTVVSNVLVLTSGTRLDQEQAKEGEPQPTTVVTLAVTPTDAERVALAASEGKISLALRNPLDVDPTETTGVGVTALMRGGQAAQPAPVRTAPRPARAARPAPITMAAPPAPAPYTVETFRAAKRGTEVVR
jgi:pilus assembly protein CpaB